MSNYPTTEDPKMSNTNTNQDYPLVSVVIEGYNELHDLGTAKDTLEALSNQKYPLNLIEIILVGTSTQVDNWKVQFSDTPFYAVKPFAADGINYYGLKNICLNIASGQVLAFTDSDVNPRPEWISSGVGEIQKGADAVVGPSLFGNSQFGPDNLLMRIVASLAWGFVIGKDRDTNNLVASNMLSHNVIFNADSFRQFQFDANYGRTCSAVLLYKTLMKSNRKVALSPTQQTVHSFSWKWWLFQYHRRIGYEVYKLRRIDDFYPNKWISNFKVLEPLVTLVWHILLDVPRWLRFSKALNENVLRRWLSLPIVVILSFLARTSEMFGMYATLTNPEAMQQWSENA